MLVQTGAGEGSAIADSEFKAAGAQLADTAEQVWGDADLLLKVKEPVPAEYELLRRNQILFTYLHLAASRACTEALLASERRRSRMRRSKPPTAHCRCWRR